MEIDLNSIFKALSNKLSIMILKYLISSGKASLKDITQYSSTDRRKVKRQLDKLIKLGIVNKSERGVYEINGKLRPILTHLLNLRLKDFCDKKVFLNNMVYEIDVFLDYLGNLFKCKFKDVVVENMLKDLSRCSEYFFPAETIVSFLIYSSLLDGDYDLYHSAWNSLIFIDPSLIRDVNKLINHVLNTVTYRYIYRILPEYFKRYLLNKEILFDPYANVYSVERIAIKRIDPLGDIKYLIDHLNNYGLFELLIILDEYWGGTLNLDYILETFNSYCKQCTIYLSDIGDWLSFDRLCEIIKISQKHKVNIVIEVDDTLVNESYINLLYKTIARGIINPLLVNKSNKKITFYDGLSVDNGLIDDHLIIISSLHIIDTILNSLSGEQLMELLSVFNRYISLKEGVVINRSILRGPNRSYINILLSNKLLLDEIIKKSSFLSKLNLIKQKTNVSMLSRVPLDIQRYNILSKIFNGSLFPLKYKVLNKNDLKLLVKIVFSNKISSVIIH